MAQRRMFSLSVVDTDAFLDLPASSQNLYFHLGMRADDDGFVSSPKKITVMVNCSTDDLKLLIAKGFIIRFESGVCVVRDWKMHNYIPKDRYHETRYLSEKKLLSMDNSGAYSISDTTCIQNVSELDTQVRLGKDSIDKDSIVIKADKPPKQQRKFVPPTVEEVEEYCRSRNNGIDAAYFVDYYTANGWSVGKNKMKDWKAAVRNWERRNGQEKQVTSCMPSDAEYLEGWGNLV